MRTFKTLLLKIYKILPIKIRFLISYILSDKYVIGVIAFVVKDKKLLLLKHTYQYSWGLPGGWLKKGEDFSESIAREIKEETGLKVKIVQIFEVRNVIKRPVVDIAIACKVIEGDLTVDGVEVEEAKFFPLDELPEKILHTHMPYIKRFLKSI